MPFPDSPRVIYQRNPLEKVICQLRFPPILKIDTQIPSDFQDIIRGEYPLYSETKEMAVELPPEITSQLPPEVVNSLPFPTINRMNYLFETSDENWTVNLTNNFVALTCKRYDRWENFREHFTLPFNALLQVYKPAFFSRIGLRYVDVIRRSKLGLEDANWHELIQPYISGILSSQEIKIKVVQGSISKEEVKLDDGHSIVRIVHGIGISKINSETIFLIDCDFFIENERTEINHAFEKLDYFNHWGRRLFRWCITDRLHNAMDPQPL